MHRDSSIAVIGKSKMMNEGLVNRLKGNGYCDVKCGEACLVGMPASYFFYTGGQLSGLMENIRKPADLHLDNMKMNIKVIERAWSAGVKKLLYLATSCVYPPSAPQPLKEDSLMSAKLEPISEPSAITRVLAIKMCQYFRRQYGCNFISAVASGIYGAYDDFCPETGHVLPAMISQFHNAKVNNLDSVTLMGTGKPQRDWMHMDDVADACVFLMQNYNDEPPINIASGEEYSITELAEIVASIIGFKGTTNYDTTRPDGASRKILDGQRLLAMGWKPQISIEEGIKKTYDYYTEAKCQM